MTVTAQPPGAAAAEPLTQAGPGPALRLPRVRTRRRPALVAAGVALTALGALGAAYLVHTLSRTTSVLAVTTTVQAGEVLQRSDLTVADLSTDPVLATVPAGEVDAVVGRRATRGLGPGSLLTPDAVTDAVVPVGGQSLVGVSLTPAQLPFAPLVPGDRVRVVDTPGSAGAAAGPAVAPTAVAAVVVGVGVPREDGSVVVDVMVPADVAAGLAASVSTGRVALVLDSRER